MTGLTAIVRDPGGWHGPQRKGAMKDRRETRRIQAAQRATKAQGERLAAQAQARQGRKPKGEQS